MSYFDPQTWRAFSNREMSAFLKDKSPNEGDAADAGPGPARSALILHTTVSPLDIYTYLKARFGRPNGIQSIVVAEDAGNLFHWDYYLYAGDRQLSFTGATQEVHVSVDDRFSDQDWHRFLRCLKADFGRIGKDKALIKNALEKWYIFPNRYLQIANRCADLHHTLALSLPKLERLLFEDGLNPGGEDVMKKTKRRSRLLNDVTLPALELPILTPVLFECFIGLIVGLLIKPEVKDNPRVFEAFKRSNLDVKLYDLHTRCRGFERGIAPDNPVLKRFLQVVARRNDLIHGNVDPVRDAVEIVYFDGKKPLYQAGGDRITMFWRGVVEQYRPAQVLDDYLATHACIVEVMLHMEPAYRRSIELVLSDTQPGWDDARQTIGKLFPETLTNSYFGLRYDSDLEPAQDIGAGSAGDEAGAD